MATKRLTELDRLMPGPCEPSIEAARVNQAYKGKVVRAGARDEVWCNVRLDRFVILVRRWDLGFKPI
ncbi:MAG: hypothetical protein JWL90_2912 [Chthoniobacteraceae bacterium]|nr:hypothetical protein [Chthoniobacteraceae bacterium]